MNPSRFVSLGRWYATPLSPAQALRLHAQIEARERERLRRGASSLMCRMAKLIALSWLSGPAEQEYQSLAARAQNRHSRRARALLELIYGQLLLAQRKRGALAHLDSGFADGRHLFAPGDYFTVLKRHALFRMLPPEAEGPPLGLEDLLTTARVIERLQGNRRRNSETVGSR